MRTSIKDLIAERVLSSLPEGGAVLDLGCGRAENWARALGARPDVSYVGIEPKTADASAARDNLRAHAKAAVENGYASDHGNDRFDAVVSLSVLEHVKELEGFIETGVRAAKPGAPVVHLYDLGHALTPSSFKERLQVWLGGHAPRLLPAGRFSAYVDEGRVRRLLDAAGAAVENVTYHQMPNHKHFALIAPPGAEADALIKEAGEWEFKASPFAASFDKKAREKMFLSVCVWARKKKII